MEKKMAQMLQQSVLFWVFYQQWRTPQNIGDVCWHIKIKITSALYSGFNLDIFYIC